MRRRDFVKTMTAVGSGLIFQPGCAFRAGAERPQLIQPNPDVKRVLVMFKCHFGAGFVGTQYNVVHKYFNHYFPHAIEIARAANAAGKRRYVWTTGSWLLFENLERASGGDRKTMDYGLSPGLFWNGTHAVIGT